MYSVLRTASRLMRCCHNLLRYSIVLFQRDLRNDVALIFVLRTQSHFCCLFLLLVLPASGWSFPSSLCQQAGSTWGSDCYWNSRGRHSKLGCKSCWFVPPFVLVLWCCSLTAKSVCRDCVSIVSMPPGGLQPIQIACMPHCKSVIGFHWILESYRQDVDQQTCGRCTFSVSWGLICCLCHSPSLLWTTQSLLFKMVSFHSAFICHFSMIEWMTPAYLGHSMFLTHEMCDKCRMTFNPNCLLSLMFVGVAAWWDQDSSLDDTGMQCGARWQAAGRSGLDCVRYCFAYFYHGLMPQVLCYASKIVQEWKWVVYPQVSSACSLFYDIFSAVFTWIGAELPLQLEQEMLQLMILNHSRNSWATHWNTEVRRK